MRILSSIVLLLCLACAALAQDNDRALERAAANGVAVPVKTNVNESVNAQAVLIPMHDARRIFGKEIGERYAVIEVNVGNKSPDAALIIHGIFVDYSRWPLSGSPPPDSAAAAAAANAAQDEPFMQFQSSTRSSQIASEEYRIVRGQFLNAQTWRKRSWVMRLLTLAGNVAGAYTFSINEQGFIKGIAAFNGVVVPGIETAWPDTSLDQLNRINDFGFQTNKVVPKQSAEVIVCFFPIDRFLTPGFARLFRKAPSLFFAPLQLIVDEDPKLAKEVDRALGEDLGLTPAMFSAPPGGMRRALREHLPCYLHIVQGMTRPGAATDASMLGQIRREVGRKCLERFGIEPDGQSGAFKLKNWDLFKPFAVLDYLSGVSLNKVSVTVDGSMNLDITTIAPRIDAVAFDEVEGCGGADAECFWSSGVGGGARTGTITGSFLSGGAVSIAEAKGLKIENVEAVAEGSGEKTLRFSFKLKQGVPTGKVLTFNVTKPKQGGAGTLDSNPFAIPARFSPGTPTLGEVELKGNTLTVSGAGFVDAPAPNPLSVKLLSPDGLQDPDPSKMKVENEKITLELPADPTPGCWQVIVKAGTRDAIPLGDGRFAVVPTPTVTEAKIQGDKIVLGGTDLFDTESCGGKSLSFRLVNTEEAGKFLELTPKSPVEPTGGEFNIPEGAKTGKWKAQVLVGGVASEKSADLKP